MSTAERLTDLINDLRLAVVSQETAVGEVGGTPLSLSVLGNEPLALLFGFRVKSAGGPPQPLMELLKDSSPEQATLTFEDDHAWLSLYHLDDVPNEAIRYLVGRVTDLLAECGLAVEAGCIRCRRVDGAILVYEGGKVGRACPACLEDASERRRDAEAELNRPSLLAAFTLPIACTLLVLGWAGLWTVASVVLNRLQIDVIELHEFTYLVLIILVIGTGFVLGRPLGAALRRSGLISWAPKTLSGVISLGLVTVGEFVCALAFLWRVAGVVDLKVGWAFLQPFLMQYSSFWITMKVLCFVSVWIFSAAAASERRSVRLEV